MFEKKNRFELFLVYFLFLPPVFIFMGGVDIAKQVATLILLFSCLVFLFCGGKIKVDYIAKLILLMAIYILINTFVKGGILLGNVIPTDFAEIIRIFGIFIFYCLGVQCSQYKNNAFDKVDFYSIFMPLFILLVLVLISYLLRSSILGTFSRFYSSEDHRFSGLMPGINYIWFPSLIIGMAFVFSNKRKKTIFSIFTVIIILLLSLILSASFSSIASCFFALFIYVVVLGTLQKKLVKLLLCILVLALGLYLSYLALPYLISSGAGFVGKFSLIINVVSSGDISKFTSLAKRFDVWESTIELSHNYLFTGHGPAKSILRYTDNTYIMSLFRYGLVGLFFEIYIYTSILLIIFRKLFKTKNVIFMFPIILLFSYLLSGLTVNVFYELKLPYVLFFIFGFFINLKNIPTKNQVLYFKNNHLIRASL